MSDFQDFARTVMGRSFGSQNNSNQDPGKTLAIAILMYPPQVAWFMDNGAYPSEGYVNNKEKIDWINDELHRLNAYYGSPIYPGLHSFGVRKSSKTRIDRYGNLRTTVVKKHRWEHWMGNERATMLHLTNERRFKVGTAINNYFIFNTIHSLS